MKYVSDNFIKSVFTAILTIYLCLVYNYITIIIKRKVAPEKELFVRVIFNGVVKTRSSSVLRFDLFLAPAHSTHLYSSAMFKGNDFPLFCVVSREND